MSDPSPPTQIYEMLYCLVTFAILLFLYWKTKVAQRRGILFSIFLICVFFTRFILEFIKRPQEDFEEQMLLNVGQLLSVPFVMVGIGILLYHLWQWGREKTENRNKAMAAAACGLIAMGVLVYVPMNAKTTEWARQLEEYTPSTGPLIEGKSPEEVKAFLQSREFESPEGNVVTFGRDGNIYVQGKRVAGPYSVQETSNAGNYYVAAPGVWQRTQYAYYLRYFSGGKSVLLNLKDKRGNYVEKQSAVQK